MLPYNVTSKNTTHMRTTICIVIINILVFNFVLGQSCNPSDPPASVDYVELTFKGSQSDATVNAKAKQTITTEWAQFTSFWIKTDAGSHATITQQNSDFKLYKVQEVASEDPFFGEPPGYTYHYFSSADVFHPYDIFPLNTNVMVGKFNIDPPSNTVELVMTDIVPVYDAGQGAYFYYRNSIQFCLPRYKDNLIYPVPNVPLPIKLSTFMAKNLNENSVKLDWTTSLEINSDYFAIERSQDGRTWTEIGMVAAAGNSNAVLAYDYIDSTLPLASRNDDNTLYYKLRLVDQDGKYAYSDIRVVHLNTVNSQHNFVIYPNPGLQYFNIDLTSTDATQGDLQLKVYDMLGKLVIDKDILGGGIELLDMGNHPSGLYQLKITQGNKTFQSRISKI